MNENVQIQAGSSVQVAEAEDKDTVGDKGRYSIAKIVWIVIFAIAVMLAVCIGLRKGQQKSVPLEDLDKDTVTVSETVVLPLS